MRRTNERRNCHTCGQHLPEDRPRDIRDFWFFDGVPPRNITISNIDGIYHDGPTDRLLVFETKHEWEHLLDGQRWLLEALARKPGIDVVLLKEDKPYLVAELLGTKVAYRLTYDDTRVHLARWFSGQPWGAS